MSEHLPVPAHDRRDGLDDHHLGVAGEDVEGSPGGETHAETPDEDPDARLAGQPRAAVDRQLLFGAVAGAVHQLLAVHAHGVALADERQRQLAAIAGQRPIDRLSGHQGVASAAVAAASMKWRSSQSSEIGASRSALSTPLTTASAPSAVGAYARA